MSISRETLGSLGTPAFSGSSRPILGLDWSATARDNSTTKDAQEANQASRPESATHTPDDAKIDAEFARFERTAEPMPGGGWYDPEYGRPEMPHGVPGEDWQRFIDDCGNLGKAVRL